MLVFTKIPTGRVVAVWKGTPQLHGFFTAPIAKLGEWGVQLIKSLERKSLYEKMYLDT